jgi:hypothetical protein
MLEINDNVRRLDAAFKRRGFVRVNEHKWQGGWITVTYLPQASTFRCHFACGKTEDLTFFDLLGNARDDSNVWEYVLLWADQYAGYDPTEDPQQELEEAPQIRLTRPVSDGVSRTLRKVVGP